MIDSLVLSLLDRKMRQSDQRLLKKLLPKRRKTDNKAAGGKCLVIAGSASMPGAGILAAKAAARSGAGYVYLAGPPEAESVPPDFIRVSQNKKINFGQFQAVAIGPGLGNSAQDFKKIKYWLTELKKNKVQKVVVDADAINFLARFDSLLPLPFNWVVTPHAGELSRILKLPRSMSTRERLGYLSKGQKRLGGLLLLKGNPTYLTDGEKIKLIKTGNHALAKAGTGDVLTGMIAGFMAQGLSSWDASYLAASIHGLMADEWVKSKDHLSLMASDLIEALPSTLFKLRK